MSTEIKEINGRCESGNYTGNLPRYTDATISLTRFAGGSKLGAMIQLTIRDKDGYAYVQLEKNNIEELAKTLIECYNYDKYPSEQLNNLFTEVGVCLGEVFAEVGKYILSKGLKIVFVNTT